MSSKNLGQIFAGAALALTLATVSEAQDTRKITLCHATGSASNPFVLEEIAVRAASVHLEKGDVYPSGGTCPGGVEGAPTATPEPITMLLFGAGLAGVGYVARRRKQKSE